MKYINHSLFIFLSIILLSCNKDDDESVNLSSKADLLNLELLADTITYLTNISGTNIALQNDLLYGTLEIDIKTIDLSLKATSDKQVGDILQVDQSPISIIVTAEDGTINKYTLTLEVEVKPPDDILLFQRPTETSCDEFAVINFGELTLENNMWNAANLPVNSYSQCIYMYENMDSFIFGWDWTFPNDAYGVNAYPQVIYGWKPWFGESTTSSLPLKISSLSEIKVSYEVEIGVDNGDYNLAFDNWITSSSDVDPTNIQFEFMIWEDVQNLSPFGDYIENVTTTNGIYEFYMGEPDWEPAGSNWTYVAFARTVNRQSGTVDVDELLEYMVSEGIVSTDSYLASIEFGNEVGNSTGYCIVNEFEVEIK